MVLCLSQNRCHSGSVFITSFFGSVIPLNAPFAKLRKGGGWDWAGDAQPMVSTMAEAKAALIAEIVFIRLI